jgi:hypothetical protein
LCCDRKVIFEPPWWATSPNKDDRLQLATYVRGLQAATG